MANEGEEKEEQVTRLKKCFTMNGHCQHTSFNRPAHYSFVRNRFQTTEQFTLENQFNSTRIIVSTISSSKHVFRLKIYSSVQNQINQLLMKMDQW